MRFQEIEKQAIKDALYERDGESVRGTFEYWLVGVGVAIKRLFPFLITNRRLFSQENFAEYPYWYTYWEQKLHPEEAAVQWMDAVQ